jgi:apolipoprotein D and lipocalin family protein
MSLKWVLLILILGFSACITKSNDQMIDKTTVKSLDIQRYLGTWYEIARFQHSFEKDLVGCTATYTLKENGKIEVLNQGYYKTLDGRLKVARGKAKLTDQPGKLRVAFFLFFYAEYNVLELDPEGYQWALIGSSTPGYLWILSRTPAITDELYQDILRKAEKRCYDITKIFKVPQRMPALTKD